MIFLLIVFVFVFLVSSLLIWGLMTYLVAPQKATQPVKNAVVCSAFLLCAFLSAAYFQLPVVAV